MFAAFIPYYFILDFQFIVAFDDKDMENKSIIHHLLHCLTGSSCTIPFLDYGSHFFLVSCFYPWSFYGPSRKIARETLSKHVR